MKQNKLGIWMDHDQAQLIEFNTQTKEVNIRPLSFKHQTKFNMISGGEHHDLTRDQRHRSEYFKHLGDVIANYTEVLLFGPTTAKVELLNSLSGNSRFSAIGIHIKNSDKMTERQKCDFVQSYFVEQ